MKLSKANIPTTVARLTSLVSSWDPERNRLHIMIANTKICPYRGSQVIRITGFPTRFDARQNPGCTTTEFFQISFHFLALYVYRVFSLTSERVITRIFSTVDLLLIRNEPIKYFETLQNI